MKYSKLIISGHPKTFNVTHPTVPSLFPPFTLAVACFYPYSSHTHE
ncbi:MAG: hypothetical protein IJV19_02735 [Prevotella sp.]|nr:hypothetical protein [Prevotella sp.]